MSEIFNFRISSLSEDCVNVEDVNSSFIIDFDRFRKEFRNGAFSSLRSVDFVELKGSAVFLIEITDLKGTVEGIIKKLEGENNVRFEIDSYVIKKLIKAEYREKLFESLFLLQFSGESIGNKRILFLIVLCSMKREDVMKFKYLESFLSSLLPENWDCKIILESTFRQRFVRR
jgi:hypothetical protein